MPHNLMIHKAPGDGSLTNLTKSLGKFSGMTMILEVTGDELVGHLVSDDGIQSTHLYGDRQDWIKTNADTVERWGKDVIGSRDGNPVNLIVDLHKARSPYTWAAVVNDMLVARRLAGIELPDSTAVVAVLREPRSFDIQMEKLASKCLHVIRGSEVSRFNPGRFFDQARNPDLETELRLNQEADGYSY